MPRSALHLLACVAVLLLAQAAGAKPAVLPERERTRIEALISSVQQLQGAHFIRNGKEYSGSDAASFLRKKWQAHEDTVRSAEEFIDRVASFSSTTSKPYLIRYADGREEPSAEFLRARLTALPEPDAR